MKSTRDIYQTRSYAAYSVFGNQSKSIDHREYKKIQKEKLEKVKQNKEQNQRNFQNKIDRIVRRSVKKEQAAQKHNRQNTEILQYKKSKMDERRDKAMSTVKSAMNKNERLGMRHYRENWQGIDW